jgi:hypothetical protein
MDTGTALCSVVTHSVLQEFLLLKSSFELFHGKSHRWFVRCDQPSAEVLREYPNIVSTVFTEAIQERPDIESRAFRELASQKTNALSDAWAAGAWQSVLFLDADLTITATVLSAISLVEGSVLLTPNFYPPSREHLSSIHGVYNSGFVVTRTRAFHDWWREGIIAHPEKWTDQGVLNDAARYFEIGTLPETANVGFWRSESAFQPLPIPAKCMFLHVHFFQPLISNRQWIDRAFAVHCLEFLRYSPVPEHHVIFNTIMAQDLAGWYRATMQIRVNDKGASVGGGPGRGSRLE